MEETVLDMDASDNGKPMVLRKWTAVAPDRNRRISYVSMGNYWMLANDVGLPLRTFQQEELDYLRK